MDRYSNIRLGIKRIHLPWNVVLIVAYILLPWVFFACGTNVFSSLLTPGDGIIQGFPTKLFALDFNVWNPYIIGGSYNLKDVSAQAMYPPLFLVLGLLPNVFGYNLFMMLHYSFAGIFMYLYLKAIRLKLPAAFFGGVAFMFSGFMCAHLGHTNMVNAAIYLPLILYCIEKFFDGNKIGWVIGASLAFAFVILADYLAVALYTGMVSLPYIVFRSIMCGKEKQQRKTAVFWTITKLSFIVFVGGVLLTAVYCLPIYFSLPYAVRDSIGYYFFSSYNFDAFLFPMLLFPFILTDSYNIYTYAGTWNFTEISGYMPIFTWIFGAAAFIKYRKKAPLIVFWAFIAICGGILILGDNTPLYKILYHIPGYNMFRAPARNWLEINMAISVLFAFGINEIFQYRENTERLKAYTKASLKVAVGICVIALCTLVLLFSYLPMLNVFATETGIRIANSVADSKSLSQILVNNFRLSSPAIYVPLIFIFAALVIVWMMNRFQLMPLAIVLFSIVFLCDAWVYSHFSFGTPAKVNDTVSDTLEQLTAIDPNYGTYRVFETQLTYSDTYPMNSVVNGVYTINAYGPSWTKDYTALTNFEANGMSSDLSKTLQNPSLLGMLCTKYIITSDETTKTILNTVASPNATEGKSVIDQADEPDWQLFNSAYSNGVFRLACNGENVSLIEYPDHLEPFTSYLLTFSVIGTGDTSLTIDLYRYTSNETFWVRELRNTTSIKKQYSMLIYTNQANSDGFLRFILQGTGASEISNIKVSEAVGDPAYELLLNTHDGKTVYLNSQWVPRLHFVRNTQPVASISEVSQAADDPLAWDMHTTAMVEGINTGMSYANGTIVDVDYSDPNRVSAIVSTDDDAFLVLSDTWYPGWIAYVDGSKTEVFKTNGVWRGIEIKGSGEHSVEFVFKPMSFYVGLSISCATFIAMGSWILISELLKQKRR